MKELVLVMVFFLVPLSPPRATCKLCPAAWSSLYRYSSGWCGVFKVEYMQVEYWTTCDPTTSCRWPHYIKWGHKGPPPNSGFQHNTTARCSTNAPFQLLFTLHRAYCTAGLCSVATSLCIKQMLIKYTSQVSWCTGHEQLTLTPLSWISIHTHCTAPLHL